MRTLFCTAIAFSLFLFSCKKNDQPPAPEPPTEKIPVKFTVADFNRQVTDLDARKAPGKDLNNLRDSLNPGIEYLYYNAYGSNGQRVSTKVQILQLNNVDFGTITDSLPADSYIVVLVGSSTPVYWEYPDPNSFYQSRLNFKTPGGELRTIPDLFYKRLTINVAPNSPLPDTSIILKRMVGKLEVVVTDALPNDSIDISISYESYRFNLERGVAADVYMPKHISKKDVKTFSDYVLNLEFPFTVTINALDRTTGALRTKTANMVYCYKNKKTILSGNMFTSTSGFKVSVDDAWDADAEPIHF
ncbi:hypothetical protein [Chitinophaga niabensis]|uniref:Fimbrillin-A associated anchor protein Mfa1 and Mfa2 n=1 Tax=Chitinophaga niabensis TaxID=536979 RepID=A0A1N6D5M7_9BACT|nr:hypothetical protein [Chitinophaga niabensis]SIN66102.1 hypothetical protein SAMN04488055_0313 [Chitinophaga niabensis]